MKKYLALAGVAIFIVALASTAALAQFKAFGHMEIESYWSHNMTSFNNNQVNDTNKGGDDRQGIAERMRLHFTYGDPKTVQAYTMFEFDSYAWGEQAAPANNGGNASTTGTTFGNPNSSYRLSGKDHMGAYQTDTSALELAWAFLDFTLPNTPVSAKIGLQRFIIGGPGGRFWMANDAPGAIATVNFAPHAIQAFWWRENTQNLYTDNNNDMYGLRYLLNQKNLNLEVFAAYQNDRRTNTGGLSMSEAANGTVTMVDTSVGTVANRPYDVQPWWVGFNAPVKIGNLTIDPTFIYNGGKIAKYTSGSTPDVDLKAWLADLSLTYRLGPGLSVTAEGFYSSGHDSGNSTTETQYQTPTNSEGRNAFGQGKFVFFFQNSDLTYYGYKSANFMGLWFGRANVEYSPLSWLNLGVNYIYMGDNASGNGSVPTLGLTNPGIRMNQFGRTDQDKSTIGQEINLIATMKIYQNFRYMVGLGYFIPGDVWDNAAGNTGRSADAAWNILTNLKYTF